MTDADNGSVATRRENAVLRITLDRPGRRNSLNQAMMEAMVGVLTEAAFDNSLRAIHITGAGADFCAGADLTGFTSTEKPRTGDIVRRIPHTAHRIIELIHSTHLPVVCSVRGYAAGLGCNLALSADFTVASGDAVFWEPFMARGFSPDSGSTWLLPRLVGLARARRMLLLGEKVGAADAAEWGLIHACVGESELDSATSDLLTRLTAAPTVAFGLTKQAIHYGQHATLSQAMTQELFNVELSARTGDFKEGLAAFRERRAPRFEGR